MLNVTGFAEQLRTVINYKRKQAHENTRNQ
jgi:hypothetical protein